MIAMEPKNYTKFTYFILPFIIPDKTLLSEEFGFIDSYSRTIMKKTTIILMFKYDLKNHNTLHEVLEALDNYKSYYINKEYEMFEFHIPNEIKPIVLSIITNNVYGLLSECKLKIITFWKELPLNYLTDLLKDLMEIDVLSIKGIDNSIYNKKGID